jgi:hypothetical protein
VDHIFLDCDGVLADFDAAAFELLGQRSRIAQEKLGAPEFWKRIHGKRQFYRDLAVLPDGRALYQAVAHLHPVILTGCPAGGWAEPQKIAWAEEHFPGVKIITCRARDKFFHMKHPGDVLVDDYPRYQELWEQAGGIFVLHTSAADSIRQLAALGFEVRPPHSGSAA